jgi:predicted metal-dependent phosphoesterase TrpH
MGPTEAIAAILDAGGVPVLAHFREAPARGDVLDELMAAGLAGLEVYYRTFDAATVAAVEAVARGRGLLATGGTDHHGDLGPYAESHARLWVPPEVADTLLEAIEAQRG